MSTERSDKIKVIFYGVGAIGCEVARFGLTRPWLEAVGAVDTDHNLALQRGSGLLNARR